MSNKKSIQENLVSMGFQRNYIARAFKVYERNYGHSYNVEVITEIIVRLQKKDRKKRAKDTNRKCSAWHQELSFDILKSNQLLNTYVEWMSVKSSFGNQTSDALKWLKQQKIPFKKSRMSYVLICGYGSKGIKIPLDVQNIIVSFCNFMFIKLFYSSNNSAYEYHVLDTNITIRDLAKILETEHNLDTKYNNSIYSNFVHIFCRFGSIKNIYTIKTNKMTVNLDMLKGQNALKWVEVPDDSMHLYLKSLDDKIESDKTLEIGVDIARMGNICDESSKRCWSFESNINKSKEPTEWMFSLNIGDIIDVYNTDFKAWICGMIRYISLSSFYIHYIGYDKKYDQEINSYEAGDRLKARYYYCVLPKRSIKRAKVNPMKLCWRID